jgi:NAD(P)-dependent dehydrogenase (short-subunit alcohol dehydrogenase family)
MKILVIGGTGLIGSGVVKELGARHDLIVAGFTDGAVQVDISNIDSIKEMYKKVGKVDAVVMTTGVVHFGLLNEMTPELYKIGLDNKLMGQVNVVLEGIKHLNDKGSFTLTSGILNREPILQGSSAAMVNGAIDGFVKHAAVELPRGIRINVISPTVVLEAVGYHSFFRGFKPVANADIAIAFSKSVEGVATGQVYVVD